MKRIIIVLLVLALTFSLCACKSSDYKEAMEFFEDERYERARDIFVELGDYQDSAQMVKKCDYQIALEYLNVSNYEQARTIFAELGDYEDCSQKIAECDYQIAREYLDDGEYAVARELLLQLGDYEDAADLAAQAARGMVIEYVKNNKISDKKISDLIATRVMEEDGNLLLVYAMGMSGLFDLDVRVGIGISREGVALVVGTEECASYAAAWTAEGNGTVDISTYKKGNEFQWDSIDASGYNADGRVNSNTSTLWLKMSGKTALEETTSHLEQVLKDSGLGLTMADIGFTSY